MASIGSGKSTRMTDNGGGAGNKTLGKVPSRPLGRITQTVAMQAMTSKPQHCPVHKQEVCSQGRGMGNKGCGWSAKS